ncbi:hypothetical protein ACVWYH_007311 [Bradyrhizobium sp. GM24.11]
MKTIFATALAALTILGSMDIASAQVRPRWTYDGSAVCPEGHDYARGACWSRHGGYGYRESYGMGGQAVRPRWSRSGSAVCPEGFDYAGGACWSRY